MEKAKFATWSVLALVCLTCGSGGSGPPSLLPRSNAISSWQRSENPIVVDTEAGFYNRIDGGAPRYIDHGWVSSAYGEYRKGDRSLQVAVHDMGTPENAESLFSLYLPAARTEISFTPENDPKGRRPNAVFDLNLSSMYAAYAFSHQYYIELNIDAKTDATAAELKDFVLAMLDN